MGSALAVTVGADAVLPSAKHSPPGRTCTMNAVWSCSRGVFGHAAWMVAFWILLHGAAIQYVSGQEE